MWKGAGLSIPTLGIINRFWYGKTGVGSVLKPEGPCLGILEDGGYHQGEVTLYPNDRIVLFTDGVTEVRNEAGEEYGEERLMALLKSCRALDAVSINKRIMEEIIDFGQGEVQDDVTLLVLAVGGME